jgi:NADH-quinone oxidoreductase subunit N
MSNLVLESGWINIFHASLPLLIVFAAAVIILIAAPFLEEDEGSLLVPIFALISAKTAVFFTWREWLAQADITTGMILFDHFAYFSWLIIFFACGAAIVLSIPYLSARRFFRPEYYSLLLFAAFGMGCLVSAGDLLIIYLCIETMSLAVYVLTGFLRERAASNEAALKYFLVGAFASAFLLMGIAFIFGSAGSTNLSILAERAPEVLNTEGRYFYLFGIAMILVGFGFKVAAVPFHAWAPDVYDGAPTPITAFMATAVKIAAFAAFLRVGLKVLSAGGDLMVHTAVILSVVTMLVGNLAAIKQENIKRMLAYSSIAHAGYILVAFPALQNDPAGVTQAVLFYLVAYVFMTAGAFAVVVAMGLGKEEYTEINRLASLGRQRPFLAITLSLFLVSLLGIPPTVGFFGKYYLFLTAVKSGYVWLVVVAVLNSALSAYYYLRPVVVMYFSPEKEAHITEPMSPAVVAVAAVASMGVAYFGLFPANLLAIISRSF